jgi:lipoprotein-anchoring transpeptidase ErfK/SrfK
MGKRTPLADQPTQIYGRRRAYSPGPSPPDIYVPVTAPDGGRRHLGMWLPVLLVAGLIVTGMLSILGVGVVVYRSPKVLPGIHTLGINLGGYEQETAATLLATNWQARTIRVESGAGAQVTVPAVELGLILDAQATAKRAHAQGREVATLPEALRYRASQQGFPPIWYFNPEVARTALEELAPQVAVAPVDAGIALENGRVIATPSVSGRALVVQATLAWLQENAVTVVREGRLPLVVGEVAPAVADSSALVAEANALLTRPLTVHTFDPVRNEQHDITIAAETWVKWLTLDADPASARGYRLDVNVEAAAAFLESQVAGFEGNRYVDANRAGEAVKEAIFSETLSLELRLYHHEKVHTVQPGETLTSIGRDYGIPYPWIQQANPDVADSLRVGQTITIPSPDLLLPLPIVENKRIIISLSQQRLWAYENGALKWEWPVSTGIESSPTAPGVFQVQSHEENAYAGNWDLWMPKFMGIYRPVPTSDFMNGFHGFPTRNGYNLLWTNSIGRPVTYGCILVSNDNVVLLYDWAEEGVVVEVQG